MNSPVKIEQWAGKWGLLLAAMGMAIGTGNIWRFPRVAAQNGGGSFLIAWILCLFTWSIPLLIVELASGRKTRRGVIGAFSSLLGTGNSWMGGFVAFCTIAIMFYYSVVTGWCFYYLASSVFRSSSVLFVPSRSWNEFVNGHWPVICHIAAALLCGTIVSFGVVRGIEKINKILIPLLALLLVAAAARAVTLPGSAVGLEYLFFPRLDKLMEPATWLEGLSQSAWSTGAGWGLLLTYAVYARKEQDIVSGAYITGFGNNAASILASLVVIPTIFALAPLHEALDVVREGNTGLSFIWIPRLFARLPGSGVFIVIFFLALSSAALSSLISMMEMSTRLVIDTGIGRKSSVVVCTAGLVIFGLPSALSIGFLDNQDWVWGLGLIISGILFSIMVIRIGAAKFAQKIVNMEQPSRGMKVGRFFVFAISVLIPIQGAVLLVWWLYRAATEYDPDAWWHPFHTFSVGTCLMQWGLVLASLILVNKLVNIRKNRKAGPA